MLRPSLAAALLVLGPAVGASAQSISPGLTVTFDGDEVRNIAKINRPTQADCRNTDAEWEFTVSYGSRLVPVIEAWVGKQGTDCTTVANRSLTGTATQTRSACWRIDSEFSKNKVTLKATSAQIFGTPASESPNGTGGDVLADDCDDNAGTTTYTVFILPLAQETEPRSSQVVAPLTDLPASLTNLRATFYPFTQAPDAPTNVRARTGEARIGVSFDTDSANQNVATRYIAYFDYGHLLDGGVPAEGGIGCGSGLLEQLDEDGGRILPEEGTPGLARSDNKEKKSPAYLSGLDDLGIPIGATVAASAITIDPAGNYSRPSEPVCVTREETVSGLDACNADPECKAGLTTCSLDPGSASDGLAGLTITGLALAFVLRRRRKAACAH
jgi:MYXO-CTERM domain-containing protein